MPNDPVVLALYAVMVIGGTIGPLLAIVNRALNRADRIADKVTPQIEELASGMRSLANTMDKNNALMDSLQRKLDAAIADSVREHHRTQEMVREQRRSE